MARSHNTDWNNNPWSEAIKLSVWSKGSVIPKYRKDWARKDICGWWIVFDKYGDRKSDHE